MELKNDKKLKQMMEEIAYYCKDKNYQLILAVNTQVPKDGQSIIAFGNEFSIVTNLVNSSYNVLELVKKCCESELKQNANHSGDKEKTMPEMFKEYLPEIEKMEDKFNEYLDVFNELNEKHFISWQEKEVWKKYSEAFSALILLSRDIRFYIKHIWNHENHS